MKHRMGIAALALVTTTSLTLAPANAEEVYELKEEQRVEATRPSGKVPVVGAVASPA